VCYVVSRRLERLGHLPTGTSNFWRSTNCHARRSTRPASCFMLQQHTLAFAGASRMFAEDTYPCLANLRALLSASIMQLHHVDTYLMWEPCSRISCTTHHSCQATDSRHLDHEFEETTQRNESFMVTTLAPVWKPVHTRL